MVYFSSSVSVFRWLWWSCGGDK